MDEADTWIEKAREYAQKCEYEDAKRCIVIVVEITQLGQDVNFLLGDLCASLGNWAGAYFAFQQYVADYPKDAWGYLSFANAAMETDRCSEAKDLLEKALKLDTEDPTLWNAMAYLLNGNRNKCGLFAGDVSREIISLLETALEFWPDYVEAMMLLGREYMNLYDISGAVRVLRKASECELACPEEQAQARRMLAELQNRAN